MINEEGPEGRKCSSVHVQPLERFRYDKEDNSKMKIETREVKVSFCV